MGGLFLEIDVIFVGEDLVELLFVSSMRALHLSIELWWITALRHLHADPHVLQHLACHP